MSWFKNMKIRTKLWVLVGTTVGGLLIFTAMALLTLKSVAVNSDLYKRIALGNSVVSDYVPPSQSMLEPQGLFLLMLDDPGNASKYIRRLKELRKQFDEGHAEYMRSVPAGPLKTAMSGECYTAAEELWEITEREFIPLLNAGKVQEASELRRTRMAPLYVRHAAALDEIVKIAYDQVSANEKDAASLVSTHITAMILFGSLLAALIAIIGFFVGKGILTPILQTMEALEKVASGDLTTSLNITARDEIGQMGVSLNTAVERLNSTMQEVADSAANATSSSQQLAAAAEAIASGAQEQAASLEETSASLEEITAAVRQSADNAQQASQLAAGSKDSALQGQEVVSKAITAMAEINAASAKISDIISTIDEIAFQTNLLAVNAAVEAARAGDEGRGFAVVASEVRSLAQRSAVAAKEIKVLIQDSLRKVDAGSTLVNRSGETLQGIVGSVKRVTDIVGEMAASAGEQSTGIEQVNTAMTQMDQVTQSNSAQTEELSGTAQALSEQAAHLMELVSTFTLSQNGNSQLERQVSRSHAATPANPVQQPSSMQHLKSVVRPLAKTVRSSLAARSNSNTRGSGRNMSAEPVRAIAVTGGSIENDASFQEF